MNRPPMDDSPSLEPERAPLREFLILLLCAICFALAASLIFWWVGKVGASFPPPTPRVESVTDGVVICSRVIEPGRRIGEWQCTPRNHAPARTFAGRTL